MFFLNARNKHDRFGALTSGEEGTAAVVVQRPKSGLPVLEQCRFHARLPAQTPEANLRQAVRAQGLDQTGCSSVLDIGAYQLLLVEAPEVPTGELRAAIRWRIKDLIDFHVDDAVLDVFDAPASGVHGRQDSLYVVVARASLVKQHIDLLEGAGARLDVIDIPELALRNIAGRLAEDVQGVALLYFEADRGLITLTRDATLYLARSLEIGQHQLLSSAELVEQLSLEIQRSLDYYDRHFQQAPISAVVLAPTPQPLPGLLESLQAQVGLPCREMALEEIVGCDAWPTREETGHCLLALGAALRAEVSRL